MAGEAKQIKVAKKADYLLVTFPPYESVRQSQSQIAAMYSAVDQHRACRVLIDARATRRRIPVVELYELCLYLVSKFGAAQPKMAVVASVEAAYPDRFGETVVRNRGIDLIRFVDNEEEAVGWLLEGKAVGA